LIKEELKARNIETKVTHNDKQNGMFLLLFILISGCASLALTDYNYISSFVIVLTLLLIIMYAKQQICYFTLCFGASDNCSDWFNSFISYISSGNMFSSMEKPIKCGMTALYQSMLHNKNVRYIKKNVELVDSSGSSPVVFVDNKQMLFDKCIIACPYNSYKHWLPLSNHEHNLLSKNKYFDFYSTLIKFTDNYNAMPREGVHNSVGSIALDDAFLLASHKHIKLDPSIKCDFKRTYKWRMPYNSTHSKEKKLLNQRQNQNVYFVGKEIAGNGVNYCMEYAKEIRDLIYSSSGLIRR